MALNWDMSEVHDLHKLHNTGDDAAPEGSEIDKEGDHQWAISSRLIWATMSIDLGSIKEDNIDEWVFRYGLFQLLTGPALMYGTRVGIYITREDIERRVGLSCNVVTKTRSQFLKKFFGDDAPRDVEHSVERLNKIEQELHEVRLPAALERQEQQRKAMQEGRA